MKSLYAQTVRIDEVGKMEKILNMLRIGLDDWDKSKTFNENGTDVVVYTMLCDDDQFESINNLMKG